MSSAVDVMTTPEKSSSWGLWLRQIQAILSLELRKNFLSRRSILIYLIAALPLFPLMVLALVRPPGGEFRDFSNYGKVYAVLYHGFIMRTVVFFGCAWIFMNLFRGELVDRSLHYYFLSAVRREVLVVGKYLSGLITSIVMFCGTTIIAMLLLYVPFYSQSTRYFTAGPGLAHLFGYAGITVLACVGYGAFFLVVGLFIRNPIIPALLLYGWEWLNFLLPPLLKKISVVHYLNSLMPVPLSSAISEGPLAVVAEPTPAWIAIPSMSLVTLLVLVLAAYRIRHMEIRYGSE